MTGTFVILQPWGGTWHRKSFFEYFPGGEVTTFCTEGILDYATKPYLQNVDIGRGRTRPQSP